MSHANPQRLLKNTVFLYFRLILTLGVSLYTSREVIATLGVTDYGIFNVVAGAVTMLAFLNSAMANGTQRFLTYEMGQGESKDLAKVFNTAVVIHIGIALLVFLLAQVVGRWLLDHVLTIPADRSTAAHWVLQCAIFGVMAGVLQVPYTAAIIAHERMNVYAYMSFVDVTMKLLIVYFLGKGEMDPLKLYSMLFVAASTIMALIYGLYCRRVFPECRFSGEIDQTKIREMSSFVGWNITAQLASVLSTQGVNMLLNVFFGPAINAARGVAVQASGTIQGFVSNFQVASGPQIVKTYSAGQLDQERRLIFFSCKITFILLFLMACPIFLETNFVLNLWLKNPPLGAALFLKIILVEALINTSATPMFQAIMATGNIKSYQLFCSAIVISGVGLAWILLATGSPAYTVFLVAILSSILLLWRRLVFLREMIELKPSDYWHKVALPGLKIFISGAILPIWIHSSLDEGLFRLLLVGAGTAAGTTAAVFCFGLNPEESAFLKKQLRARFSR
jgi:O-antigen/teichoic acid export membrane protein